MSDPSRFAADWLSLREAIDHRSRAAALDRRLQDSLSAFHDAASTLRVMDLGSGAGSNLRYLAARLPWPQHWTLIDHDRDLLDRARTTVVESADLHLITRCLDLARLAEIDLPRPDLVTASAWLDLVSADWIEHLAERLEAWRVPVLITLSVDGRRGFLDVSGRTVDDDDDAVLEAAFNHHQRQPKGLGEQAALGPAAVQALADRLSNRFHVEILPSDWLLSAGSEEADSLGIEVLAGWAAAAREVSSGLRLPDIERWEADRLQRIKRGELGLCVGHQDLLALPR